MPEHYPDIASLLRRAYTRSLFEVFDVDTTKALFWLCDPKCKRNQAGMPERMARCEYNAASKTWVFTQKKCAL